MGQFDRDSLIWPIVLFYFEIPFFRAPRTNNKSNEACPLAYRGVRVLPDTLAIEYRVARYYF